jgi:hypothetical protein
VADIDLNPAFAEFSGRFAASSTFARPSLSGPTSVGSTRKACLEFC